MTNSIGRWWFLITILTLAIGIPFLATFEPSSDRSLAATQDTKNKLSARASRTSDPDLADEPLAPSMTGILSVESEALAIDDFSVRIGKSDRSPLEISGIRCQDQAGEFFELETLVDRPTVLAFYYSRCSNSRKCSTTVAKCAELKSKLIDAGLDNRVRILIVTYEPQNDTPDIMLRYGQARNLAFDQNCKMLRILGGGHDRIIKQLEVPVSYNGGWVNLHGISMYLIDGLAQPARVYQTVMWDSDTVLEDLNEIIRSR